jgi:hypothetical protein
VPWFSLTAKIPNFNSELRGIILWWTEFQLPLSLTAASHTSSHALATKNGEVRRNWMPSGWIHYMCTVQQMSIIAYNTDLPLAVNFTTGANVKYFCNFVCTLSMIKSYVHYFLRWRFCCGSYTINDFKKEL